MNMCFHRNIIEINYSSLIQQNHINESKVYLNRYGPIIFVNQNTIDLTEVTYKCQTKKTRRA